VDTFCEVHDTFFEKIMLQKNVTKKMLLLFQYNFNIDLTIYIMIMIYNNIKKSSIFNVMIDFILI